MKTDLTEKLLEARGILILDHRGARKAEVPENTFEAFQRAFDVRATLDESQNLGQIKGILIPTFDEACRLIKHKQNAIFNVEIKSGDRLFCRIAKDAMKVI
ncbi:hypothetical protein [Desulfoluna sp.]|uniref:hypothetical protein n=1 Tax=Desulfoluna sp. TaxID=2045199 RepID=UPI00262C4EC7|nr:hypothetical protein [Desulfoluna sp.]